MESKHLNIAKSLRHFNIMIPVRGVLLCEIALKSEAYYRIPLYYM